jgi:hypothetical protein
MSEEQTWEARAEAGYTREAMRDAVAAIRHGERLLQERGETRDGPTGEWVVMPGDGLLADMLEQLLDEIALSEIEQREER